MSKKECAFWYTLFFILLIIKKIGIFDLKNPPL